MTSRDGITGTDLPPHSDPGDDWWAGDRYIEPPQQIELPPVPTDASATYEYQNGDGTTSFVVARWDSVNGHQKKSFSPYCWDGDQWVRKQLVPAGERPLLNLPGILDNYRGPVLVVEGEKTASAAAAACPGWTVTTWAGGSSAVGTADWSPLKDREVVIWPDNDEPGRKAAAQIKERLPRAHVVTVPLDFPEAWDMADALPANYDADYIETKLWATAAGGDGVVTPAATPEKPDAEPLKTALVTFPTSWQGKAIPDRQWLVPDLIPMHVPTMLSGKGGAGKSLLGVQATHAAVTAANWLGLPMKKCKTLAVFSEDDEAELMRRYNAVCINTNTEFGDLDGLALIIRDGDQTPLMDFPNPHEAGKPSSNFDMIYDAAKEHGAQFILLDSLYNFFSGNENNRVHVAQFVYLLRKLAKDCDAAVVFIAHPSKAGISTGDGYAGSTAWHDAVRARLFLTEVDDNGENKLVLRTMKANYGPGDGEIEVYYQGGMLWPRGTAAVNHGPHHEVQAGLAFLKCLRSILEQGKNASHSKNSGNFAPKLFSRMPAAAGFKVSDLAAAMERLFNEKKIKTGDYLTPDRKWAKGLYEVKSLVPSSENDEE